MDCLRSFILLLIPGNSFGFLTESVDLTSNLVFDPSFYVNTHGDLHHLNTVQAAKNHWLHEGIKQGRQACGTFHSKQYLHRYHDLAAALGTNYQKAVEHYLTNGVKESRVGFVEGGAENRWTISNHNRSVVLSASSRTAGAVDSLVWNHKEFINAWDHGRELQIATNTHPYGECFNPTEAGGRDDGGGDATTSKLLHIKAHGSTLETTSHPAFWLRPGDKETMPSNGPCGHDSPALNTELVYNHEFTKVVTIGCGGMEHCIKFVSGVTIAGQWPSGYKGHNLVAPTGYLTGDFHVFHTYDPTTKQTMHGYTDNKKPIILETDDGRYAMGAYAPVGQDSDSFQYYSAISFGRSFSSGTNKWGVVFRKNAFPPGGTHHLTYTAYICVGTHEMVTSCLDKVHQVFPHV